MRKWNESVVFQVTNNNIFHNIHKILLWLFLSFVVAVELVNS